MATLADLTTEVKEHLYSAQIMERPWVDTLAANYTADGTSITVTDGSDYSPQDILEFPDGDQYLVTAVDEGTNVLTVIPGWNGTTSESQTNGDWFVKNPRFTIAQIENAIESVLRELRGHGVHVWGEGDITLVAGTWQYDLSETDIVTELGGVASVFFEESSYETQRAVPFRFHQNHTTLSAQGHSLQLWDTGEQGAGDSVYYIYYKEIDAATDLLTRQEELVVYGTVARLLGATMAPRTQDPSRHTDRTVQPGQGGRDSNWYRGEYRLGVIREAAILKSEARNLPGSPRIKRVSRWRA